jgi:hypothetical protein
MRQRAPGSLAISVRSEMIEYRHDERLVPGKDSYIF